MGVMWFLVHHTRESELFEDELRYAINYEILLAVSMLRDIHKLSYNISRNFLNLEYIFSVIKIFSY